MSFIDDAALDKLRAIATEPERDDVLAERFELCERLGEGAMGVVYAAWDRLEEREVAVKVVMAADAHARARFAREVGAVMDLSHPGVVRYFAHGEHDGRTFLVTERLIGETLAERLRSGALSTTDTIVLGRRVAEALSAVHAAGITHRDIKPSNIFLSGRDVADARVIDFGLARNLDPTARVTATGALVGTPGYMAPEQVRGEPDAGPRADIFALGCVLFECLAGRPPFVADSPDALLSKLLLESPALEVREAPAPLAPLLAAMMEKSPSDRPEAEHVARELRALEANQPTQASGSRELLAPIPAAGTRLAGKYQVSRTLGVGGMGVVLEAKHLELDKRVAIKIMRRRGSEADEARFLREARATSQLESQHALRVLDVGRLDDGAPFMVMEYLEGRDLARHLAQRGPLPFAEAVRYVRDACETIAEAHTLGIVHRDLKPSNLFLTKRRDGTPLIKVLDFGISKMTQAWDADRAASSITAPTAVLGSAVYMSPEQLKGAKHVDARTDVWALGVVLHELCTATLPFSGDSPAAVGARIVAEPPTPLRAAAPDAPAKLEAIILRCLRKKPRERYADVEELARALATFASDAPIERRTRRRALWLALFALLVVVGWLVPRGSDGEPSNAILSDAAQPQAASASAASARAPQPSMSSTSVTATAPSPPVQAPTIPPQPPTRPSKGPAVGSSLPTMQAPPRTSASSSPGKAVDVSDPTLADW